MSADDAVTAGQKAAAAAGKGAAIGGTLGAALGPQGAVVGAAVGAFAGAAYELGQWVSDLFADPPEKYPKVRDAFGERRMPRGWTPTGTTKWERAPGGRKLYRFRRAQEDGASRSEALRWLADATDAEGSPPAAGAALRAKAVRAAQVEADAMAKKGFKYPPGAEWMADTDLGRFVLYKWLRGHGVDSVTAERLSGRHYSATGKRLAHARSVYLKAPERDEEEAAPAPPPRDVARMHLQAGSGRKRPGVDDDDEDDDDDDDDDDEPRPARPTLKLQRQPEPPQLVARPAEQPPMRQLTIPVGSYAVNIRQDGDIVSAWADIQTRFGPVRVGATTSIATIRAAMLAMKAREALDAISGEEWDEVEVGAENAAWGRVAGDAARAAGAPNAELVAAAARVRHIASRAKAGSPAARTSAAKLVRGAGRPKVAKVMRLAAASRPAPAAPLTMTIRPYYPKGVYRPAWRAA